MVVEANKFKPTSLCKVDEFEGKKLPNKFRYLKLEK